MSTETQCQQILAHLKKFGSITPLDALQLFGCFRLSARIYDLREQGYNIVTDRVKGKNKQFASYRLKRKRAA